MKKFVTNIIGFITLYILISTNIHCSKNLLAEIPTYIEIQEFNYIDHHEETMPYASNYHSTKITDAWVTMDDQFLGVFEIPCKIPIHLSHNMQSSSHSFDIYPGIKVNGIAASRAKYPFYKKFKLDTILARDSTLLLIPFTEYLDNAIDKLKGAGSFELDSNTILSAQNNSQINCTNLSSNSATPIIQTNVVFQGTSSLAIHLNDEQSYFHAITETMDLDGTTFLELNFKTSTTLNIGIIIVNSITEQKEELIRLHATEHWKKTYLDLTPLINEGNSDSSFKIYFEACNSNNTTQSIYIDNLKLMSSS